MTTTEKRTLTEEIERALDCGFEVRFQRHQNTWGLKVTRVLILGTEKFSAVGTYEVTQESIYRERIDDYSYKNAVSRTLLRVLESIWEPKG